MSTQPYSTLNVFPQILRVNVANLLQPCPHVASTSFSRIHLWKPTSGSPQVEYADSLLTKSVTPTGHAYTVITRCEYPPVNTLITTFRIAIETIVGDSFLTLFEGFQPQSPPPHPPTLTRISIPRDNLENPIVIGISPHAHRPRPPGE